MELRQETRAKLSRLINRIADNIDELRAVATEILSDRVEQMNLIDGTVAGFMQDEKPRPVAGIPPMKRTEAGARYAELLRPKRNSRWGQEGHVSTFEVARAMSAEFPGIDTRMIKAACGKLGINVFRHSHSSYIMYNFADVVADSIRDERRAVR